jgi:hypothetical protein
MIPRTADISVQGRSRDIREIHIAFSRVTVPANMELIASWSSVLLDIDAARVDPKVLQITASGLFSTEPDLVVTRLACASTIYHIFEASTSAPHVG